MKKLIITMLVLLISSVAYADQVKIDVGYPDFDSKSGFPQKNINDIQESVWGIIKV